MSASREKKSRQERGVDYVTPKALKEQEEARAARRATAIFAVCAVLVVAFIVFTLLNNSGVFKRSASAAVVNGETYSVSDAAYYYYNIRANALNDNEDLDSSVSLRDQAYTESEDYATWYDYAAEQTLDALNRVAKVTAAAKEAGYDGGDEVNETVSSTMDSLKSSASSNGYTVGGYIKAIFNGLVTRSGFEKTLRAAALSDAYLAYRSEASGYDEAELQAAYDADPEAYMMVRYNAAIYAASDYAVEAVEATEDTEAVEGSDGIDAAKEAAEDALARLKSGSETLKAIADETGANYSSTYAYYSESSDIAAWLFDDARKEGDSAVLDYTYYGISMGSMVVVYHGKSVADYHTVDVRHILVDDEETANDLLAQFQAGEQTEDAFAALATENSTDTGSAENGGLYEGVYKGQMVAPFEAWCFDESRQAGDTGIVATDYGYHVMYFVARSDYAYWQELAANKLANDWAESLSEDYDSELLDGMKYIDP
ncbi:MAG: peptidylprolyl isomerase [Oscillospiraceae bacterium]|nr:peptidylprolyl isomerase [Oscillospiraceae bacterium]